MNSEEIKDTIMWLLAASRELINCNMEIGVEENIAYMNNKVLTMHNVAITALMEKLLCPNK